MVTNSAVALELDVFEFALTLAPEPFEPEDPPQLVKMNKLVTISQRIADPLCGFLAYIPQFETDTNPLSRGSHRKIGVINLNTQK